MNLLFADALNAFLPSESFSVGIKPEKLNMVALMTEEQLTPTIDWCHHEAINYLLDSEQGDTLGGRNYVQRGRVGGMG